MMELAPFCAMLDRKAAVAMLAEYVVYQERPADAEVGVLRTLLQRTIEDMWDANWLQATVQGIASGADWARLLDSDTLYVLQARSDAASASAEGARDKVVISCPQCTQNLRVRTGPNLVATCPKCNAEIPL